MLNLILGALTFIRGVVGLGMLILADVHSGDGIAAPRDAMLYPSVCLGIVAAVLLGISGVGCLLRRKLLGRTLGNAYAVAALLNVALELAMPEMRSSKWLVVGALWPAVVLILLNTTFTRSFVD